MVKFYSVPWGGAALDEKNKIYYVVTGNPKPYHIGILDQVTIKMQIV